MTWRIIQGGQTGVDRGALLACRDLGLPARGFAPKDWETEDGALDPSLRGDMTEHALGYQARTISNVHQAGVVMVVVPSVLRSGDTPGTLVTVKHALAYGTPVIAVDGKDPTFVRSWLRSALCLPRIRPTPNLKWVMVAGPRASKWPGGEAVTRALLNELFGALRPRVQMELPI